eukprot:scaffold10558_cov111-Isochrysis_galbana.AAC.2
MQCSVHGNLVSPLSLHSQRRQFTAAPFYHSTTGRLSAVNRALLLIPSSHGGAAIARQMTRRTGHKRPERQGEDEGDSGRPEENGVKAPATADEDDDMGLTALEL